MLPEELQTSSLPCIATHPLSGPQLDIYYDHLIKGNTPAYNIGGYLDFMGPLDPGLFEQALNLLFQMHDALRIALREGEDGHPVQLITTHVARHFPCLDFSDRALPEADAQAWIRENLNLPFALFGEPLFRCTLIKLSPQHYYWFVCAHHLVADGWSMDLIFQSFARLYNALLKGETPDLSAPSYLSFVESDQDYLASQQLDKDKQFFLQAYSEIPAPLLLPRHQDHLAMQAGISGEISWPLPEAFSEKIDALAAAQASTRFQVLLGLFQAFFLRLEQRDDLTLGLSVLNRKDAHARKTAGMFTNVVPLRQVFDRQGSFAGLLKALGLSLRQHYRHQRFPVGELNKMLELFQQRRAQLYDLSISYENGAAPLQFGDTRAVGVKCSNDYEGTPLRLTIRDDRQRKATTLYFIFGRAYYHEAEIVTLRERFMHFIGELLARPHSPLALLPIVTDAERAQFARWNATDVPAPGATCVHRLFEQQAQQRPQAIAVVQGDQALTYAELNLRANRLAWHLIELGVRPDERVALCAGRNPAMIVGLLAILKAGGAYVPVDPAYPSERIAHVFGDAQPRLVLADAFGRRALGTRALSLGTLVLDDTAPAWARRPSHDPQVRDLQPSHLAYVIYTSGSTGQPKGVMVEHRQLCHQVFALQQAYGLTAQDRVLQFASIAFDMSVEEIFPALLSGATLVLRTDECLSSPAAFADFCTEQRLTTLNLPPAFWAQLALAQPELAWPACLRQVSVGGDTMSPAAVSAWMARIGHRPRLFNAYGPTEATVNATLLAVQASPQQGSIGRPLVNTKIYLLDPQRQPVPMGAVGELFIGGAGVARGYFRRAKLTAERFAVDPFSSVPGARMYRTGDLARYLPNGEIAFLGRNDNQVKLRGFRIELGDIESRLAAHPTVRETVVVALGDEQDKQLVAYVVAQNDAGADASLMRAWREHLAAGLPVYMVPAAFVRLDSLPLTPNGKLDRQALPAPDTQAFVQRSYEPPQGELETALAALWQELLGVERIGRHDHFFELGGHSLIAIRLLGRLGQLFDCTLPLAALFDHPTLAELAVVVAAGRKPHAKASLLSISPIARGERLPLSHAQQRLWFLAQLDNSHATYHVSLVLRLVGVLDSEALRRSLDSLLARHEALRTVFHSADGEPYVRLLPAETPFPLAEHDLRGVSDPQALLSAHTHDYTHAPFELDRGPLVRAGRLRVSDSEHVLLLCMHHIVSDGWSVHLLAQELSALYTAFSQQRPDPLPKLPIQYPDYAAWQRTALTRERWQEHADYWQRNLSGAPELLNLPTDRPRPPRQSFAGDVLPVRLDAALTHQLRQLGNQHGVSLYMLLTAAWACVLARLTAQDDVLIGTLSANRGQREVEALIGFFVSTLPLRIDLSGEPDARELLARVRRTILAAQEHQDLPFEQIVEIARPARRLDHSPLFQVLFAWQSNDQSRFDLPGLQVHQADMSLATIRYDLELHLYEQDDGVVGGLGYATALFDRASIERHVGYLLTLLKGMVAAPALSPKRVPLLSAEEQALLAHWNGTEAPYPQEHGVHCLFEQQAARVPDAIALIHGERQLTYAALNAQANRWARYLRELGVGTQIDQRVALCAERSFGMVAALLGILKAGAGYVPLDPSYPAERLQQVLQEAKAEWVLCDAHGRAALGAHSLAQLRVLELDELDERSRPYAVDQLAPLPAASADRLAYVIYTSGSSGTPKGVAMPHRPLLNLVHWQQAQAEGAGLPAPRTLQFAALGFDVAFQEIFSSLCAGAALVLVDAAIRLQFDRLIELLERQQVQRLFLPYIALQTLAETMDERPANASPLLQELRDIIVAGEALRLTPQIRRLFQRLPACRLHNHYGPTETHVVTAQSLVPEEIAGSPSQVPIGRPIANAHTYVLDPYGLPVPLGAMGELYIGGVSLARGYLDRPELSAERFVEDPFAAHAGARMYRTGDLARHLPDGRLVFLGRNDHQVKVRGFRIELGEIEARLAEHLSVRECAVIASKDARGDTQLIAYVVAQERADALAVTLRTHLQALLPAYMLPSAFVSLQALPLTAHGKLDRQALPQPDEQAIAHAPYEPPQGKLETELARLWQDLLGIKRVSRHDHFFELGGHSLIAVRLLSRVTQVFDTALPLATLFAHPVLRDLARQLGDCLNECETGAYSAIAPTPRTQRLTLSYAQQRIWFLAQLDGGSAHYHIPLAVQLTGELHVDALRHALNQLYARHESLRTVFMAERGQPYAQLLPAEAGLALGECDLSLRPDSEAAAASFLAEQRNRPFDLGSGPLIRASLARIAEHSHVLQLTLHHIIADGWSLGILARELSACYAGQGAGLPPLPIQYADYAVHERKWLTSERLAQQAAYWRTQLAGAPTLLELPTDRPHPSRPSFEGAFLPLVLDEDLTQALLRLAQRHGVTLFMLVLAAWAVVLSRLSGQAQVLIGSPTAGRGRPELEPLIGFFANTLALRIDLTEACGTTSLLSQVREVALQAQAHQELPFEQVVELAQVPRRLNRPPLVQVLLAWQSHDEGELHLPGLTVEPVPGFDWVKFELELILRQTQGRIEGGLSYASALFDRSSIERHAGYLSAVLQAMAAQTSLPLTQVPMLGAAERQLLLEQWNRTQAAYPRQQGMHEWVEHWALSAPTAMALVSETKQLSYATWNARANRLAHYLIERGLRPGDRIALCAERNVTFFVALLAILKAGCTYVPLDPAYASARLDHILEDAAPQLLLCDDLGRAAFAPERLAGVDTLDVTHDTAWVNSSASNPSLAALDARPLAYIIYTSGSTGTPKGVMVEHGGVINLALSLVRQLEVSADSRIAQFASVGFDASILELILAMAAGAALYLPSASTRQSPSAFMAFIGRQRISHAILPPAFVHGQIEPPRWTHRPMLVFGGDALSRSLLETWQRHARIANAYGPTEATVCASIWISPDTMADLRSVPVGRPIANTRLYLLDRHGLPVPRGSLGELHIGGDGVARGYLNQPGLSAGRFLHDPYSERPNARMYRTGDLMRYLPDGNLVFAGRNDDQLKLRGFRIEPGEIQAQLAAHPHVREAVVLARKDQQDDLRLVAYVVADRADNELAGALREHLAARLPEYMIPAAFVALAALPLTAHGKLDHKALPLPDDDAFARRTYTPLQGETEIALGALWQSLLGLERVGRHDHFFELGGHSLLVTQLAARMSERFGKPFPIRELFRHPVLQDMAGLVDPATPGAQPTALDLRAEIVLDESIRATTAMRQGTPKHVLLTGASGFLGAFLLHTLLKRTRATIHCLVRGSDAAHGLGRLDASMRQFGLGDYDRRRVRVIAGDLGLPQLGLGDAQFQQLADQLDVIYHNGAWVNSLHTYASLKAVNVLGTQEILRLAACGPLKPVHYISTLSTLASPSSDRPDLCTEELLAEYSPGLASGYAQSKWVAERLVRLGGERGIPFTLYRPPHIGAASHNGASNPSDTWSLFVDACLMLERVPKVEACINSLPVDYLSECIVALSQRPQLAGQSLNLLHPRPFLLSELIRAITAIDELAVEQVDYAQWRQLCSKHPATARLATVMPGETAPEDADAPSIVWSNALLELAQQGLPCPPITPQMLRKYVAWRYRLGMQPA